MTVTRSGILKHKPVFDHWLDGGEVEYKDSNGDWFTFPIGTLMEWREEYSYRIKDTPDSID